MDGIHFDNIGKKNSTQPNSQLYIKYFILNESMYK